MLRRTAFAGITGLCLLAACGDDDGGGLDEVGGGAGVGGARAGAPSGGRAGAPRGGSGGGEADAGDPGRGGSSPAEAGAPTEPDAGSPSTGTGGSGEAGGPTNMGGTFGTAGTAPTAGGTVEPGTVAGAGGAGGSDDGGSGEVGGAGGEGGTPEPEPVGLLAHFTFNEKSGMTAADQTGRFGPATLKSGATWTTGRAATGGVELAEDGAHVQLPNGLFAGVEKATIATWVNLTSYEPWSRIFDINGGSKGFMYLASDRGTAAGEGMRFSIYTGVAANESILTANTDLPIGAWKHVAVTVDGDTHSLFVDGILIGQATSKGRFPAEIEPSVNGWLGKSTITTDRYLKGKLDDFRVYDTVLTPDEIADLAWPDSDYSHYRFEETTEGEVVDYSDRALHGVIQNGAGFTEGHRGEAILLEGGAGNAANQHVSLPPGIIENCTDLTIALWAKIDAVTNFSRFLDIDGMTNGFIYFSPSIPVSGHPELRFNIYRPGFTPADQFVMAPYPAAATLTGVWHHFAVTLAGDTARLYFDGNQIGENVAMTFNPSDVDIAANAHAWIGRSMFQDPYLDAAIDDYRVSCRAFTADEIKQLAR